MTQVLVFIITFLIVFFVYEVFIVRKCKKDKRRKKPVEVQYLIGKYHLDLNKVNYKRLLNIISAVSSFDISLVAFAISFVSNFFLILLVGFALVFATILISYSIVGNIYKKKGCCK
ncbi:MAG TPA: hypothetical protein IAC24_05185 [Candidatus Onthousia faecigallinarum]|nr:hypothetical protein [Candidatus Onthousia faecigallinarum]